MNEEKPGKIARRDFLKNSATATLVAGVSLSIDLRTAVAHARSEGKPLLTQNNLNRLIRANPTKSKSGQQLGREALQDLPGFIRGHFSLTAPQHEELASLTQEQLQQLYETLSKVIQQRGEILIKILRDARVSHGSEVYRTAAFSEPLGADALVSTATPAAHITIDVGCSTDGGGLSCHFTITKKS
jgi:hypothetical protein